jgi:cell division septal protein FtsQ
MSVALFIFFVKYILLLSGILLVNGVSSVASTRIFEVTKVKSLLNEILQVLRHA